MLGLNRAPGVNCFSGATPRFAKEAFHASSFVPRAGLEPTLRFGKRILSPPRLPFPPPRRVRARVTRM